MYTLYNGSIQVKPECFNMKSNLYYGTGKVKLNSYMLL